MTATSRIHPSIQRRKVDFDTSGSPRHFVAGEALLSRWLDAMSLGFPEGERAFIRAVRNYRSAIVDPELLARVRDFSFQETQHALVHARHNAALADQSPGIGDFADRLLRWQIRVFSPKALLAWTVAAEHFTAVFSCVVLDRAIDVLQRADPEVASLYLWHAMEEIEHRSVAWDVYADVAGGGYTLRVAAMVYMVVVTLALMCGSTTGRLLRADGLLFDRQMWRVGTKTLFGSRGLLTSMIPEFLAYFRPGFHPEATPVPAAYARWVTEYERTGDPRAAAASELAGSL